jgi:hypothetical protein
VFHGLFVCNPLLTKNYCVKDRVCYRRCVVVAVVEDKQKVRKRKFKTSGGANLVPFRSLTSNYTLQKMKTAALLLTLAVPTTAFTPSTFAGQSLAIRGGQCHAPLSNCSPAYHCVLRWERNVVAKGCGRYCCWTFLPTRRRSMSA